MNLEKPNCPDCGKPAIGTIENIIGVAEFGVDDDPSKGPVEYSGYTDMMYSPDEQETVKNELGETQVVCNNHHRWFTRIS